SSPLKAVRVSYPALARIVLYASLSEASSSTTRILAVVSVILTPFYHTLLIQQSWEMNEECRTPTRTRFYFYRAIMQVNHFFRPIQPQPTTAGLCRKRVVNAREFLKQLTHILFINPHPLIGNLHCN